VNNLPLSVSLSLLNTVTGQTRTIAENWGTAVTTFPFVTPFLVTQAGSTTGAGALFTHINFRCPPTGNGSTYIVWSQST